MPEADGKPVSTYVPFRNGLFLASAASIALSNGCEVIYYGAHSDDAAGNAYPDCSEDFNNAMNTAIFLGSGEQLRIEAPFVGMNKADVVAEGTGWTCRYELTWSCYEGGEKPCGLCGTCRDRAGHLRANGITDPLSDERRNDYGQEETKTRRAASPCWAIKTQVYNDYAPEVLETFPNKHPDNDYFVKFNCPEFTSLCPITGQPDFAAIYISYMPAEKWWRASR